jgi:hypothetical protein
MNSKYALQALPVTPEMRDRQQTASYPVGEQGVMAYYASSIQLIQTDAPSELTPDRQEKLEKYLRQFELDGEGGLCRPGCASNGEGDFS